MYVGRIHEQGQRRPLYLLDEVHGFERQPESARNR